LLGASALVARLALETNAVLAIAVAASGAAAATVLVVISGMRLQLARERMDRSRSTGEASNHGLLLVAAVVASSVGIAAVVTVVAVAR
jgi:hypothetical protein